MTIRNGLLALLERGPMYGYQLRTEFEAATGGDLAAEHRAGLHDAQPAGARRPRRAAGAADEEGRVVYRITDAGRAELASLVRRARSSATPGRATSSRSSSRSRSPSPGVDVARGHRQAQRTATAALAPGAARGARRGADPDADAAWLLVLEAMIFQAEAEVRWLDHCEARIVGCSAHRPSRAPRSSDTEVHAMTPSSSCATSAASTAPAPPPCTRCAA